MQGDPNRRVFECVKKIQNLAGNDFLRLIIGF